MSNPRIQARVPDDLKEKIKQEAEERDSTQSKVARERIKDSYDSDREDNLSGDATPRSQKMNQRHAPPVASLEEAAKRANEIALYGSVLALLALTLAVIPSLITAPSVIATFASVVSITIAALAAVNIITAVIGTLYRVATIVTPTGSSTTTTTDELN
jgi:Ribbon-helix-helix protein, copG family.